MGASLTRTCQCQATDARGNFCGKFYDPKWGGRCVCGAFNWAETVLLRAPDRRRARRAPLAASAAPPRATESDDEDAWEARRERGPCVSCGLPEQRHHAPGRGGPACDAYEPSFAPLHGANAAPPVARGGVGAPGIRILRADDADELVVTAYPCVLSTVVGGFAHGKTHAILGSAGAGKSTLAAQAASAIAAQHGAPLWWLDGDQNSMGLVLRSFALARSQPHNLRVPRARGTPICRGRPPSHSCRRMRS
jgi:hypothetical protein